VYWLDPDVAQAILSRIRAGARFVEFVDVAGVDVLLIAANISSVHRSTPASRARDRKNDAMIDGETEPWQ
jgi:hypothetical protein